MTDYLELLRSQFNNRVRLKEKRPNILQLVAPFYHEDGDMMDIFLEIPKDGGKVKVCDFGMTLMRLSYNYEIDTPNKERIFHRILQENDVMETDGNIWLESDPDKLYSAVMQLSQAMGKVSSMQYYKREVIQSLFYEMLNDFVVSNLGEYSPVFKVLPIEERDDLEVDWQFSLPTKPVYLFGVKDSSKSRLVTISCLEFQKAQLPFISVAIHEDYGNLPRKDQSRLTSAVDKQFVSLEDFQENGKDFLKRAA